MVRNLTLLVAILAAEMFVVPSPAQEPPASVHPLTVNVVVGGDDETVGRVKSYIPGDSSALAALGLHDSTCPSCVPVVLQCPPRIETQPETRSR
jgi:hypothetical protein